LRASSAELAPGALIERVADETGYRAELEAERTHESEGRLENLAELIGVAASYESLEEFLSTVALVADSDELDEGQTRVSLMTLHVAKGLEYPAVFMIGLEEGIFPHFRSLGDPVELEEERRLAYVGITRARRHLILSHAWVRSLWGQTNHNIPSRFLAEVPTELFRDVASMSDARSRPWSSSRTSPGREQLGSLRPGSDEDGGRVYGSGSPKAAAPSSSGAHLLGLDAGDRVRHERWGEGQVLSLSGSGDRTTALVRFDSVGAKTLMLSMAPLTRA
jgi:DNA helicase-2/ATP-dependent DNA helicase PcrA